ncbi:hypothetical protein PY257_16280 [Ramlibacter sp. H39-3-26]|uniref:hypothetical protein n=1 Tax=Curvibacter soli TaxID=3031331 RepID=UPI0023DB8EE9|nr:hypothetical protein [Ramlibacter sp. H39-3-26]MDF1486707.1 hypothetical protein [Ramlibacter sp. H39-3-26]
MLLASYKSTRPGLQGIANRLIRLRLRSPYSHTEVVFEPHDPVAHLMPDGSTERAADGSLWCASSVAAEALPAHSTRRAGKMGGVRFKRIALNPDHWDVKPMRADPVAAAQWFASNQGALYDWQLIAGFLAWFVPGKGDRWTCSEAAAAAAGAPNEEAWRVDPCNGHILLPSFRE